MPSFALRFVGQEALPSRLSEFDREQFRSDHRLPAALMVMFMRVAGRQLDAFNVFPRNLLRYTAAMVGVSPPSIAALRSIYKRTQTLFKHQLWAKTYLGLRDLEQGEEDRLTDALRTDAQEASHADDLVQTACHWLFTRRILIPGPRRLLDLARDEFAAVEAQILAHVSAAVPVATVQELSALACSVRPGTDATQLEWLRTPSKRHGPTTLAETLKKVCFLRALGAHTWDLSGVALAKQQGLRPAGAVAPAGPRRVRSSPRASGSSSCASCGSPCWNSPTSRCCNRADVVSNYFAKPPTGPKQAAPEARQTCSSRRHRPRPSCAMK